MARLLTLDCSAVRDERIAEFVMSAIRHLHARAISVCARARLHLSARVLISFAPRSRSFFLVVQMTTAVNWRVSGADKNTTRAYARAKNSATIVELQTPIATLALFYVIAFLASL